MEFSSKSIRSHILQSLDKESIRFHIDNENDRLYVKDGLEFPTFILEHEEGFIEFFSWMDFKDGKNVDAIKANELINRINCYYVPNSVYHDEDGSLFFRYYLPVMHGFSHSAFIEMLRWCPGSFITAVMAQDTDNLVSHSTGHTKH